jgi:hypothetical protein
MNTVMDKVYWILTIFIVSPSLIRIWLNLRELLARNNRLENLSKRSLLNSVLSRGLYTILIFGFAYWLLSNLKRDTEYFFVGIYIWNGVWAVEAFTGFLISCKELIRNSRM